MKDSHFGVIIKVLTMFWIFIRYPVAEFVFRNPEIRPHVFGSLKSLKIKKILIN
jgi:hypothetical protein